MADWYGNLNLPATPLTKADIARAVQGLTGKPKAKPTLGMFAAVRPQVGGGGSISNYTPTIGDRIQGGVRNALMQIGLSPYAANQAGGRTVNFLNDLTPAGSAFSAEAAGRDWRQGNYLGALGNGAMAAIGAVPGIGSEASKAVRLIPGFQVLKHGPTEMHVALSPTTRIAELNLIRTAPESRGAGNARAALRELVSAADRDGITLALTPDPMGPGVSKDRLNKFYREFGFVPNAGRNKDFSTRAGMLRPPQK